MAEVDARVPAVDIPLKELQYTLKVYTLLHRQHIIDKICRALQTRRIDQRKFVKLLNGEIGPQNVHDAILMTKHMCMHERAH